LKQVLLAAREATLKLQQERDEVRAVIAAVGGISYHLSRVAALLHTYGIACCCVKAQQGPAAG
jgi:hypothetical protein